MPPATNRRTAASSGMAARGVIPAFAVLLVLAAAWPAAAARKADPAGPPTALRSNEYRQERLDKAIRAAGFEPSEIVLPYVPDEQMRRWARSVVGRTGEPKQRLEQLLAGLLGPVDPKVVYKSGFTPTAAEAFHSGTANCLAFTHLFVGLARDLGLDAYYLDVTNAEIYERQQDLIILSGHVTAGYGTLRDPLVLEYNVGADVDYRWVRRIDDVRALAMYYSNRGAEILQGGDAAAAVPWLRKAVTLDPRLAQAWVNYGVVLRRLGEHASAEEAYRQALEADPRELSAYQNLARLLRLDGRDQEARELEAVAERQGSRNPWNYLQLGDMNLRYGRVDEAERMYKKALGLDRDLADAWAALGFLAQQTDQLAEARRLLDKAKKRDPENPRVARLERALAGEAAAPAPIGRLREPKRQG